MQRLVNGKLPELSNKPNCVSTDTKQKHKKVAALDFKSDKTQTLLAIKDTLNRMGSNEIKESSDSYFHVVFTTKFFRFKDDVDILLNEDKVHFRSESRLGRSDLGANKKRYEEFSSIYNNL